MIRTHIPQRSKASKHDYAHWVWSQRWAFMGTYQEMETHQAGGSMLIRGRSRYLSKRIRFSWYFSWTMNIEIAGKRQFYPFPTVTSDKIACPIHEKMDSSQVESQDFGGSLLAFWEPSYQFLSKLRAFKHEMPFVNEGTSRTTRFLLILSASVSIPFVQNPYKVSLNSHSFPPYSDLLQLASELGEALPCMLLWSPSEA